MGPTKFRFRDPNFSIRMPHRSITGRSPVDSGEWDERSFCGINQRHPMTHSIWAWYGEAAKTAVGFFWKSGWSRRLSGYTISATDP